MGRGAIVFAVMGYVIANMKPDKEVGMQVELNPRLLHHILGESEGDVEAAIAFLSGPDPESRSKEEGGRRLVRLGQFAYRVVNGLKYRGILDEEALRDYNRVAQWKHRAKEKGKVKGGKGLPGERAAVKAESDGNQSVADHIANEALPVTALGKQINAGTEDGE